MELDHHHNCHKHFPGVFHPTITENMVCLKPHHKSTYYVSKIRLCFIWDVAVCTFVSFPFFCYTYFYVCLTLFEFFGKCSHHFYVYFVTICRCTDLLMLNLSWWLAITEYRFSFLFFLFCFELTSCFISESRVTWSFLEDKGLFIFKQHHKFSTIPKFCRCQFLGLLDCLK